jgi:hypothetical protein
MRMLTAVIAALVLSSTASSAGEALGPKHPPAAPKAAPAQPSSAVVAPPGPCRSQIDAIRPGTLDPETFLPAAECLRHADSAEGRYGHVTPDARLQALLPDNRNWYVSQLERFTSRRDVPRALAMAYLAETRSPSDAQVWRAAAEAYVMAGETFRAALTYLRQIEADSSQGGYLQFQIENLIRSAGSDISPPRFLDSLAEGAAPRKAAAAQVLEQLCWSYRYYAGAYRLALEQLSRRDPGPGAVFDRVNRFLSLGYWDYAAGLLEKYPWRQASKPWPAMGRALFLRAHYQLQDWPALASETSSAKNLGDEEEYIAAAALLHVGKPSESIGRLQKLEPRAEPPWGFRARLLEAQAQMALGKFREAGGILNLLKKDPDRREATGPILFWQGFMALQQSRFTAAESLLVLSSAYTGTAEAQRALDFRFWLLLDTTDAARVPFFLGLPEAPHTPAERAAYMDQVPEGSPLWPYARLEKAQILLRQGQADAARAVLDEAAKRGQDRVAAFAADAQAAYLQEKTPEGRRAALARYEDLLVKYQQGVVPEFSRGRIKALKQTPEGSGKAK